MKKEKFENCVRAIIFKGNKILVCKSKSGGYYFFPGGHIRFQETAKETLERELKEELDISIKNYSFVGAIENIHIGEDNRDHHEFNLVFKVETDKVHDRSQEDHINFTFLDINQFLKEKVLPIALQKSLVKWLKDRKPFWASQVYNKTYIRKI